MSALKALGEHIINIHGQNDNKLLFSSQKHIDLLDLFIGRKIFELKNRYQKDLLLLKKEQLEIPNKTCEFMAAVALLFVLILTGVIMPTPIFANDLIANSAITTPALLQVKEKFVEELDPQAAKNKFETKMTTKYSGMKMNNVSDGIKHIRMTKYYNGQPVKINVIEMNQRVASNYEVKPATASPYSLHNKSSVRSIAGRTNSIVAVNGGYFKPQTGVPLGTLMIDGKIYTGPIYDRVALGIFEDRYEVGRVGFAGSITGNNQTIKIDNINQPRMLSSYVLAYTRDWGKYAPASPRYGVQLQIQGNKITAASANPLFIPEDGYVLVGPKSVLGKLFGAQEIEMEIGTNPQWKDVKHIISGGPYLVKNGNVYVDIKEEKLLSVGGRNPRTAIGYTADNNLIIVTADGREESSIGMTLWELAGLMKSLGCVNAINLDGGGSTVMYVNGQIVNQPPQIGGIALSNALVISKKM